MPAACYIASDLSSLRLGVGAGLTWQAERTIGEGGEPTLPPVRQRAEQAATFVADTLRREQASLGVVCVSVDDAMCSWIAAPSADEQVIAAAVRRRGADWNRDTLGESVQALAERPKRRSLGEIRLGRRAGADGEQPSAAHLAVLEALDGPLRLWLDALDRRSIRPATVQTLWHASATVWTDGAARTDGSEAPLVAALLRERADRLVWAWGRAGALIAGGACADAPARVADPDTDPDADDARVRRERAESLAGRISLDWLTWAAQLGESPSRIVIVAPDADSLAEAIESRWQGGTVGVEREDDPVGALLRRLAEAERARAGEQEDPRRSLVSATRRPARAHRRLIFITSFALLLMALGVGALGVRARQTGGAFADRAADLRAEFGETVQRVAPSLAGSPAAQADPVAALRSELARIQQANPPITEPSPPRAIKEEMERFFRAIAEIEGVTLEAVQIEERTATATVATGGFAEGEGFLNRLRDTPGRIRWTGSSLGAAPNLRWRLSGSWEDDR
ncbi:MAG: hypothetical protein ACF8QF_11370 [Phycisphaerales bacterium]